jgi:formylglycine-generating enzyme required for sulfatase activity
MRSSKAAKSLEGIDFTTCSSRAAMGYPDTFIDVAVEPSTDYLRTAVTASAADLARLLESPHRTVSERLAIGQLINFLGDGRCCPLSPEMLPVPAGTWEIGLPFELVAAVARDLAPLGVRPEWIAKETPKHSVELAAFRIARFPVTNSEFRQFLLETDWPILPTSWQLGRFPAERANHPVYTVTPATADAYVRWLAAATDRAFRLPTEAEWEVAAGGAKREYPWGDYFDPQRCNTLELGLLDTTPVGSFPDGRSYFGADDMAGNVEEIVSNDYAPYPGGRAVADHLANGDPYRVTRGGCFSRFRDLARTRRRHGWIEQEIYAIGFRVAETL